VYSRYLRCLKTTHQVQVQVAHLKEVDRNYIWCETWSGVTLDNCIIQTYFQGTIPSRTWGHTLLSQGSTFTTEDQQMSILCPNIFNSYPLLWKSRALHRQVMLEWKAFHLTLHVSINWHERSKSEPTFYVWRAWDKGRMTEWSLWVTSAKSIETFQKVPSRIASLIQQHWQHCINKETAVIQRSCMYSYTRVLSCFIYYSTLMCAGKRVKMLTHNSVSSFTNTRMNKNNEMENINNTNSCNGIFSCNQLC
jgi:hypothetical protein